VDHLHAEPSVPSTPITSRPPSRPRSPRTSSTASIPSPGPVNSTSYPTVPLPPARTQTAPSATQSTPPPIVTIPAAETTPLIRKPKRTKSLCNLNHYRDEALLSLILLNSPRLSRGGLPHSGLMWGRDLGCVCPMGRMVLAQACDLDARELASDVAEDDGEEAEKEEKPKIGRRRQVVGILVS
jgi:zinc transporter 1/2/3